MSGCVDERVGGCTRCECRCGQGRRPHVSPGPRPTHAPREHPDQGGCLARAEQEAQKVAARHGLVQRASQAACRERRARAQVGQRRIHISTHRRHVLAPRTPTRPKGQRRVSEGRGARGLACVRACVRRLHGRASRTRSDSGMSMSRTGTAAVPEPVRGRPVSAAAAAGGAGSVAAAAALAAAGARRPGAVWAGRAPRARVRRRAAATVARATVRGLHRRREAGGTSFSISSVVRGPARAGSGDTGAWLGEGSPPPLPPPP
jgi:hypothetical protein